MALFLGLTMLPFAIVAPLIGPFLDRFSHGRRWAIGATFAIRAFLCWVLAGAVADDSALLYPGGARRTRLLQGVRRDPRRRRPPTAAGRLHAGEGQRPGLARRHGRRGGLRADRRAGRRRVGSEWALRYAFVVFVVGTIAAIRLPEKVDSTAGEQQMSLRSEHEGQRRGTQIPPAVAFALRANCGPRWLSGFLILFLAFLLRDNPIDGWEDRPEILVGLVIGAAGPATGWPSSWPPWSKKVNPAVTVVVDAAARRGDGDLRRRVLRARSRWSRWA